MVPRPRHGRRTAKVLVLLAVLGMLLSVAVEPALAQPPQSGVPTPASVVRARVLFVATFTPSWTEFTELTVTQLTKGADVVLSCRGHGCPLIFEDFDASGHKLSFARLLASSKLAPHSVVTVQVNVASEVSKIFTFTTRSGAEPALAVRCLDPGAKSTTACP
jgi:hypothetical protein